MLASIAVLGIVFWFLRKESLPLKLLGLALTAFSNWFLFYSDKLMPDILVAFSLLGAIASLYEYKFSGQTPKNHFLWAALFVAFLFFGFLAKETIILFIPLLMFYFLSDWWRRQDLMFWKVIPKRNDNCVR